MRFALLSVLVLGASPSLASAQGWSITAHAPIAGDARTLVGQGMSIQQHVAQLPIGAVAPGQFLASQIAWPGSSVQAAASWQPGVTGSTAPLSFTAAVGSSYQVAGIGYDGMAILDATLDLTLAAPQATTGRLLVQFTATIQNPQIAQANFIKMDVGANGSVDFLASGTAGAASLPLTIQTGGSVVRLAFSTFTMSGIYGPFVNDVHLTAQFVPHPVQVHSFDTTGAGAALTISHGAPNAVTIGVGNSGETPLLLAFGAAPVQVPVLPTITVLVTLDALYPVGTMTLPLPPLPPGTAIYAQGLALDTGGVPRSTNSIRALWQ